MTIASSVIDSQVAQKDGRISVVETHTDQTGAKYQHAYLSAAGANLTTAMTAYAPLLDAALTQREIDKNTAAILANGRTATLTAVYSTVAQNAASLRAAYITATRVDAVMIGDYLGSLTDAQLQTAFGMTAAQVTTLRSSKLTPAASAASTVRATTGA